ncbi:hypothetical protein Tco_0829431 [Tanacetum coccineum]
MVGVANEYSRSQMELGVLDLLYDLEPSLVYEVVEYVSAKCPRRKRTKEDTRSRRSTKEDELRLCDIFVVLQGATPICEGSCRLTSLERQEVWNDCRSCKVRVGSNGNLLWEASVLLGRKKGGVHGDDVAKTVFRMRNGHVEVYGYAFWVNQCTSGFHGVNEPGGVRVAREDDRGVTEGREDVREVFQQRGSGAKRKLSRCGRNQMGNEPILALPEGADDFVVYYDARSKDLEACLEKGEGDCLLTNRWLSMKKDIASCGSKYLAYLEVEVEYQGSSGLLLQPELPELWVVEGLTLERCSTFGKKDKLERSYVGPFEILGLIRPIVRYVELLRVLMSFLDDERGSCCGMLLLVWGCHVANCTLVGRGPELTWEREDYMKSKYPQLFVNRADEWAS